MARKVRYCQYCSKSLGKADPIVCHNCGGLNFRGWDYEELIEAYSLEFCPEELDEDGDVRWELESIEAKALQQYFDWALSMGNSRYIWSKETQAATTTEMHRIADILRQFLTALGNDPAAIEMDGMSPIWLGMAACENDWNLLAIASRIVGTMWS
jgi:hypothetical protein